MRKLRMVCLLLWAAVAAVVSAEDETARLDRNWDALRERGIDLLPVPKHLEFQPARTVSRLALSGLPDVEYRSVIAEELSSRLEELGSAVKLEESAGPVPGAFNVVLAAWDGGSAEAARIPFNPDSRFEQAYTLSPVADGVVLRGRSAQGLLYAAVTLRWLLTRGPDGALAAHPAAVADWPDFAVRQVGMRHNLFGWTDWNDPGSHRFLRMAVKWALRSKINAIGALPMPSVVQVHRLNCRKPYFPAGSAAAVRGFTDYARANGIRRVGFMQTFIELADLADPADAADPRFKGLMVFKHSRLVTWAHLDWHREINRRFADFCREAGISVFNHHSVDSGSAGDPELWSRRDPATRLLYGDDRLKAGAALWTGIHRLFQGTGIQFGISQYPYRGSYLDAEEIMKELRLPGTQAGREAATGMARRNTEYLSALDRALPRDIEFCLREDPDRAMRAFLDAVPERPVDVYWEVRNGNRDVLSLVAPEIAMTRAAFVSPRRGEIRMRLPDDYEFYDPSKILFAEFTWNRLFPGGRAFDREHLSPAKYPAPMLRTLARRTAEGLWGSVYGPRLAPVFDDLASLAYAYDPVGFRKARVRTRRTLDDGAYLERNAAALGRAAEAASQVFAEVAADPERRRLFKPGSYPYFADMCRMLRNAELYGSVNAAVDRLEDLARKGRMKECESLHAEASARLAAWKPDGLPGLDKAPTRTDFPRLHRKAWVRSSSTYRFYQLLRPDTGALKARLDDAYGRRHEIFARHNVPEWFRRYSGWYFFRKLSCRDGVWRHFFRSGGPGLAPNPVELRLRHDGQAIVLSGAIAQDDPKAYPPRPVTFREWPRGDSAGIHLLPPGGRTALQVVVSASGGAYVCRHTREESGLVAGKACDLGLAPEVKRTAAGWEFSVSIPFSALDAGPGRGWKALLEYNGGGQAYSSAHAGDRSFNDPSFWQDLAFSRLPEWDADVLPDAGPITLEDVTHTSGSGTRVTFRPKLESTVPILVRSFTATVRDGAGKELSPAVELLKDAFVPLCWTSAEPLACQLEVSHPGVAVELAVAYVEDEQEKRLVRTRCAGDIALPGEPFPDGTPSLRNPFDAASGPTQERGAVRLSIRPHWNKSAYGAPVDKTLFHFGPRLKPGGFNWKDTMLVQFNCRSRTFTFNITNARWKTILAKVRPSRWDGESPLDIAAVWDTTGPEPRIELRVGDESCDRPTTWGEKPFPGRFDPSTLPFPIRFGAKNNGRDPADCDIGRVGIWKDPEAFRQGGKPDAGL